MGEGSSENSGMSSPVPASGGTSPNPQTTMPSPGASPPVGKDTFTQMLSQRII